MEPAKKLIRLTASAEARDNISSQVPRMPADMEQRVVSSSGECWEVEDVRLYRSTDPNVLLFAPTRVALERNGRNGRWQAALTQFRQWSEGVWHYVSGSALMVVSSAVVPASGFTHLFTERWRSLLFEQGYSGNLNPVFMPLPRRRQRVQLLLDSDAGSGRRIGAGTLFGDAASLAVELTGVGAQEWRRAVREKTSVSGSIRWCYEYPVMLPEAEAWFTVDGTRVSTQPQFAGGDLSLKLVFQGRTWVETSIETEFTALLHPLDESYLNVVPVESATSLPVVVRTEQKTGAVPE